jgi:hypothetical protein
MLFEELSLRRSWGAIDHAAISAWLDSRPFAFRDPSPEGEWHLSATPRHTAFRRQKRIDDPSRLPLGVRVRLWPDRVVLTMLADRDDLARGLEFVQWLVRDGAWIAKGDRRDPEPVGDPRRLFPDDLPDPASLVDDPTLTPVMDGTLVTFHVPRDGDQRKLAVHSSGEWRYVASGRTLRGRLSIEATAAFNMALAAIDPDDPALPDSPDEATWISMTIQSAATDHADEDVELDTIDPPPAYRSLIAMIVDWMSSLDRWTPDAGSDVLQNVREAT